jgi:hypothetical protein
MNSTHSKAFPSLKRHLLIALPLLIGLAGCETLHARWAKRSDSPDAWSSRMATLPIHVHAQESGVDPGQIVARIPNGTTVGQYATAHPTSPELTAVRRLEMYVGGVHVPTFATYCAQQPVMRTINNPGSDVMLAAAICDGPRLVATVRESAASDELDAANMPHTVERVKGRLIFALSRSPSQIPTEDKY